eukprot:CAMPEP_0176265124 /NCGR_PEP_ID=MMETSP0121_2-20121125/41982_1 /TAXON_ID=160619 /ORGANISM="Kryptoperidinium foliaceum, Strain CCMP 1326" /LENGTH=165 /DNA_ID=CAMNT_0017605147 /DNA_START=56 /DNA_END=550 /DNA_ORIENTATION=+
MERYELAATSAIWARALARMRGFCSKTGGNRKPPALKTSGSFATRSSRAAMALWMRMRLALHGRAVLFGVPSSTARHAMLNLHPWDEPPETEGVQEPATCPGAPIASKRPQLSRGVVANMSPAFEGMPASLLPERSSVDGVAFDINFLPAVSPERRENPVASPAT